MTSLNRATLIGNLGGRPEIKTTANGNRLATFSIATSESWRDKDTGEKRERTEWHRVVCFNEGLVGVIEKYLDKGSKVYIEGAIRTRSWEEDGAKRYATEIVMQGFDSRLILLGSGNGKSRGSDGPEDYNFGGNTADQSAQAGDPGPSLDDEIPF